MAIKLTIVGAALGFGSTCLISMLRVASRRLALPCLRPCLEKAVSTVEWTGQFGLVRALQPGLSAVSMLTCVAGMESGEKSMTPSRPTCGLSFRSEQTGPKPKAVCTLSSSIPV